MLPHQPGIRHRKTKPRPDLERVRCLFRGMAAPTLADQDESSDRSLRCGQRNDESGAGPQLAAGNRDHLRGRAAAAGVRPATLAECPRQQLLRGMHVGGPGAAQRTVGVDELDETTVSQHGHDGTSDALERGLDFGGQ
jgi:hypothetical protein